MRRLVAMLLAGCAAGVAQGAEPAKASPPAAAVDAELLEFLGSLDVEEEGWQQYLEERPIRSAAAKPAPDTPPPRAAESKPAPRQVKDK